MTTDAEWQDYLLRYRGNVEREQRVKDVEEALKALEASEWRHLSSSERAKTAIVWSVVILPVCIWQLPSQGDRAIWYLLAAVAAALTLAFSFGSVLTLRKTLKEQRAAIAKLQREVARFYNS